MALVLADRVLETTTTTGTGTITLAGASGGYQSFAVIGNGNTTYYTINSGTAWEVGIGTYSTTGPTLARTTILSSSAGGSAISLTGTSTVFVTYPAEKSVNYDAADKVGIGTTAPAVNLEVSSAFNVSAEDPAPTEVRISTTTVSSNYPTDKPWGRLSFYSADASDGGAKIQGAIDAISDTTAGGRMSMVFSTSIATFGTLTERMRLSANGNVAIITNQTSGGFQVGGASGTGTITLGQSTASQTTNIQAGVTASGSTKTINLGTGAASGATSTITIGSATSGATQTTTVNGRVTLAPIGASAAAWTTAGINLIQNAATFTDTSSTGTVADIRINNFDSQTLAASSATTVTRLYGTYFNTPIAGTNVTASNLFALGVDSLRVTGTSSFASTINGAGISLNGGIVFNTATSAITMGTSQTTGVLTLGNTAGTGTMTLGQSTASQTTNIQAGATASGSTKTINLGTGGLSGSTTTITIGSTLGSTTSGQGSWSFTSGATTSIFTVGVTNGTGTITFGQSTASQTTNIQAGVTASGSTKTINLGTGAASGATSTITIGSATSGATQTTTINGRVTLAPIGASAPAWTNAGINLIQSAATFTDTTSSGSVAAIYVNNFAAQTVAATNSITVARLYGTFFVNPVAGTNVTATERFALGADTLRVIGTSSFGGTINGSGITITGGVTFGTATSAINIGLLQTTGTLDLGSTVQTGTMTLGLSTASQTTNIQAGATASGSTKTINLGTGGLTGSTTNITIGSAVSGATQTTTINGNVTLAPIGASAAAWTTNGIALTQSAATFTDTTSSGTVADIRINNFAAQTLAASSAVTVTQLYGTYFTSPAAGTNVTATERFALGADSLRIGGAATFGSTFTIVGGANTVGLATSQSSGQTIVGGTSATGTITLGRSTGNQTTNIQAGATASGSTKTINLGTGGLSGSTTTINIGSADGTSINLNAPIRMAAYTVATLPAAGTAGRRAYVTDALAPMFLVAVAAGGSVVCPVFDNGTAWVAG
jgi:hypothetical protein